MDIVTRSRMSQKPVKGVTTKSKEEDFRARRRKFYRLATEEKPMFPFQQRNFHNFVMENKEVMKMLSLLTTCAQDMKQVTIIYILFSTLVLKKVFIDLNLTITKMLSLKKTF